MTAYHGGKQKIGKRLAELISKEIKKRNIVIDGYCEPFVGMCGVYRHIPMFLNENIIYKGGDINKSVILMWKKAQKGWKPKTDCTKERFKTLKYNGETTADKGFLGHAYGFGGQYFGSYRLDHMGSNSAENAAKNVEEIGRILKNVEFYDKEYFYFSDLENYVIYCDPPYSKRNEYYTEERKKIKFDHNSFWDWVRMMSKKNLVFVSEYSAPEDFIVLDNTVSNSRYVGNASPCEEKLYIHRDLIKKMNNKT